MCIFTLNQATPGTKSPIASSTALEVQELSEQLPRVSKEEHEVHLKFVLESLRKDKLFAKFSKSDGQSERMIQTLEDIMRAYVIDFGGRYHLRIRCAPFEALLRKKCRPLFYGQKIEKSLTGLDSFKNLLIRRKPLEFEVGDRVLLRVSPWKSVVRFGKKGKLAPRYVGPFKILERIGLVAIVELPKRVE
ncbi:hypothetical protein Tco_0065314 [Tanacetum coccineum]